METYRYRITLLRGSGSVWVQDYTDIEHILRDIESLVEEYPHIVVSKQRIIQDDDE